MPEKMKRLMSEEIEQRSEQCFLCTEEVLSLIEKSDREEEPFSPEEQRMIKILWYYLQRYESSPYAVEFSENTNSVNVLVKPRNTKLGAMEYRRHSNNDIEIAGAHPFGNPFTGDVSEHKSQGNGIPLYVATFLEIQKYEALVKNFRSHPMASDDDIKIWTRFEELGLAVSKIREGDFKYKKYFEFLDLCFLSPKRIEALYREIEIQQRKASGRAEEVLA